MTTDETAAQLQSVKKFVRNHQLWGWITAGVDACVLALCMVGIMVVPIMCTGDLQAADVKRTYFEVGKIHNLRNSYIPNYSTLKGLPEHGSQQEYWDYQVGLGLDLNLITNDNGALYWDQLVVGQSTNNQYRSTYWDFEIGIAIDATWEIYHHHRSLHVLDAEGQGKYPLSDIHGIRICFYGEGCAR